MLNDESLSPHADVAPSTIRGFKHILHFYSSGVNKYSIQIPSLQPSKEVMRFTLPSTIRRRWKESLKC